MATNETAGDNNVIDFRNYHPKITEALDQALSKQRHPTHDGEITENERTEIASFLDMLGDDDAELLQVTINTAKSRITERTLLNTLRIYFQHHR